MSDKKEENTFNSSDVLMEPLELDTKVVTKEAAKDGFWTFVVPSFCLAAASAIGYITGAFRANREANQKIKEHNIGLAEKYLDSARNEEKEEE